VADTTATQESSREYIKESTPGGGSDPTVPPDSITPDSSQLPGLWADWEALQKLRKSSNGYKGLNDEDLARLVSQVEDDEILPVGSTEKIKNAARFRVVTALRERGTQSGEGCERGGERGSEQDQGESLGRDPRVKVLEALHSCST
jgi:hypothetical protein